MCIHEGLGGANCPAAPQLTPNDVGARPRAIKEINGDAIKIECTTQTLKKISMQDKIP